MHAYDQQSWPLFHRCGPPPSFWTAEDRSYRNHQMKLIIIDPSGPRENQNTIEKNEFYEWGIWRTIMRTMSENNSICIKINSWFRRTPSAPLPTIGPVQANLFNSWPPSWSDQITSNEGPVSTPSYHRPHTDQHFNSWPPEINENFASTPSYYRPIQANIWSFSAEITPRRQHHMEIFDDFHIEKYFHLFSFMGWILNFISIHPINGMNKWSILIIYSFMK